MPDLLPKFSPVFHAPATWVSSGSSFGGSGCPLSLLGEREDLGGGSPQRAEAQRGPTNSWHKLRRVPWGLGLWGVRRSLNSAELSRSFNSFGSWWKHPRNRPQIDRSRYVLVCRHCLGHCWLGFVRFGGRIGSKSAISGRILTSFRGPLCSAKLTLNIPATCGRNPPYSTCTRVLRHESPRRRMFR